MRASQFFTSSAVFALLTVVGASGNAARATAPAAPTADQIIAKARSVLGTEDKLNGLRTLRLSGNLLDDKGAPLGTAVLMFKKAKSQRIEINSLENVTIVRASDGVSAWGLYTDKDGSKKIKIYHPPELEDFVYSGLENLYFYRGTQLIIGSQVTLDGEIDYHGAKCWKVSFHYPQDITFVRYFDQNSGELRGTVAPGDVEIRENGKMTVDGITFPAVVENYDKDGHLMQILKISKIEINQPMDSKLFMTPSPSELFAPGMNANITLQPTPANQPGVTRITTRGTAAPPVLTPLPPLKLPRLQQAAENPAGSPSK